MQKILKAFGFVQQEPSYPLDITEIPLITYDWVINHMPLDYKLKVEKKRLKKEKKFSERVYEFRAETVLFNVLKPLDREFLRWAGNPECKYLNMYGREENLEFSWKRNFSYEEAYDNYVELFKRDANGSEREVGPYKLGNAFKPEEWYYKYIPRSIIFLRMVDDAYGSNLEEQFYMMMSNCINQVESGLAKSLSHTPINNILKYLEKDLRRMYEYYRLDNIQNNKVKTKKVG